MKTFVFRARLAESRSLLCSRSCTGRIHRCVCLRQPVSAAQTGILCFQRAAVCPSTRCKRRRKKAAIGINCAWDDRDILPMLSTLQQNGEHATFFLLGEWAQKYPDAAGPSRVPVRRLAPLQQPPRQVTLSQEEILQEIHLSCQNIHAAWRTDACPLSSTFRCLQRFGHRLLHRSGCIPIQWDLDTLDWQGLSAQEIEQRVRRQLAPGSILLLHAGAEYSAQALPLILNVAQEMGYQLFPVGELIDPASSCVDPSGRQLPAQS